MQLSNPTGLGGGSTLRVKASALMEVRVTRLQGETEANVSF